MKILFLCWEYPPIGAGIGRYIAEISSAFCDAGHSAVVLASRGAGLPEREESAGREIYRLFDRAEIGSARVAKLAGDIARQHQVDWVETADHWGEGAALLRSPKRPPVVVKMHYNDVLKTPRYAQVWYAWQKGMVDLACTRQWRSIHAERYSIEHADALLAPCQRMVEEAERQGLALPKNRAVVPNPIRPIPGWTNDEAEVPTLLLVGRLDMGKGLPYIKGILARLAPEFPNLRFEVAGADSYARGVGSIQCWLERQLGPLRQHVHFLGVLGRAALDEAYRRAWVILVPSRWDTFPQVILEAMVRKKAIVASPNGGMPEMLEGTGNIIADPSTGAFAHAVGRMLANGETRLRAGASAYKRALNVYNPAHIVGQYIDFLKGSL